VKQEVLDAWRAEDCCYELTVEQEIFWRRGAPAGKPTLRRTGGK
jgi:hypothetical protein